MLHPKTNIIILHNFYIWFSTGISHILDRGAYDHLLFLLALCCVYNHQQWKQLLLVITAFTIGHSLALVLSILQVFILNGSFVEFLIALTIILTCLYNMKRNDTLRVYKKIIDFLLAAGFGIIHGMGFAGVLKEMLGNSTAVLFPLFSFNIGIETGQILIVGLILLLMQLFKFILRLQQQRLSFFISVAVGSAGVIMAIFRFNDLLH